MRPDLFIVFVRYAILIVNIMLNILKLYPCCSGGFL